MIFMGIYRGFRHFSRRKGHFGARILYVILKPQKIDKNHFATGKHIEFYFYKKTGFGGSGGPFLTPFFGSILPSIVKVR